MAKIQIESVEIRNFEKYKGRRNYANNTWFRCSNRLLEDPDFYDFSAQELLVWIYVLSIASQKDVHIVPINARHVQQFARATPDIVLSAMRKLSKINVLTFVTSRSSALHTKQDITKQECIVNNNTLLINAKLLSVKPLAAQPNGFADFDFDFDFIYKKYPRKIGRKKGLVVFKNQIKSKKDYDALSLAVDRYLEYCRKEKIEPKFIKHFSTFMNSWSDWVDPETGTSDQFADNRTWLEKMKGVCGDSENSGDEGSL